MASGSRAAGNALSADAIVTRAIRLADQGGLESVSMRRLAAELSVTPMALYWHFENKDALVQAMAERAVRDIALEHPADAPWPDRLRSVLRSVLAVLIAHPWLGRMRRRVIPTPHYLRLVETLLETMRDAGYDSRRAVTAVDTALDGIALLAGRIGDIAVLPTQQAAPEASALQQLRDLGPAGYPRIAESAEALTSPDEAEAGEFVIDVLVRGLEAAAPGEPSSASRPEDGAHA